MLGIEGVRRSLGFPPSPSLHEFVPKELISLGMEVEGKGPCHCARSWETACPIWIACSYHGIGSSFMSGCESTDEGTLLGYFTVVPKLMECSYLQVGAVKFSLHQYTEMQGSME